METQTPVLSDADQLYFERVAADCLDLLGPGMELTGFALDRDEEVTVRLSYRLGTAEWTSEGHGPTIIAAHASLREQLVLDRIRVGIRALTAWRSSSRRIGHDHPPKQLPRSDVNGASRNSSHGGVMRSGTRMLTALAMFTLVSAGCGASATSSASPPTVQDPRARLQGAMLARIARGVTLRMADAHAAVGVVGQAGSRCQGQGLQARADRIDRRRGLRGHVQGGLVRGHSRVAARRSRARPGPGRARSTC